MFLQTLLLSVQVPVEYRIWCCSYYEVILDTSEPIGDIKMLIKSFSLLIDGLRI